MGKEKPIKLLQRKLSRTAEELEAETTSYLICKKLGLQSNSADYIASYIKKDQDLIEFNYETVLKTTDKIEYLFLKLKSSGDDSGGNTQQLSIFELGVQTPDGQQTGG